MFTIFSIPKPFTDPHINIIQTNAINSWLNVSDTIEIILCGNDFGVKEICQKNNIQHISNVECTNSSTPLLSSVFNLVREKAKYDIIIYINADIIITSDFLKIFNLLPKQDFLIVGRRYDLNITKLLDFSKNWEEDVKKIIKKEGILHAPAGSDYFIFRKELFKNLPHFAVGRVGWDNWMLQEALNKNIFLIDATPLAKVIHQNHDYKHKAENLKQEEDKKNISLSGISKFLPTLKNIKYEFRSNGIKKRIIFFNNFNQIIKKTIYYSIIKFLTLLRGFFSLMIKISKKIIQFINAPLFYLEQNECEKFNDCKLLAKVLYNQPPNSDRYQEYPWMLKNIKITSGKILDVGSTASNMLYDFLPKEVEINSIDLNNKEIKNNAIKFSIGDIRKTNYPDNSFDMITCISTLEHIGVSGRYGSDDDLNGDLTSIKELTRVLKPGGTILITIPYGIKDVLPINKLYTKERLEILLKDFSSVTIEYKKYFKKFNLWLNTNEIEAAKTDMIKDQWYFIAFIKAKK